MRLERRRLLEGPRRAGDAGPEARRGDADRLRRAHAVPLVLGRRRRGDVGLARPAELGDEALKAAIERERVVLGQRLPHAHEQRDAGDDLEVEREAEVVADRGGERLGGGDDELAARLRDRKDGVALGDIDGDEPDHRGRRRVELPGRGGIEAEALGQDHRQHGLVDAAQLEEVRGQVAPVEDLARDRVLDGAHRRGPALDEDGAQGRHLSAKLSGVRNRSRSGSRDRGCPPQSITTAANFVCCAARTAPRRSGESSGLPGDALRTPRRYAPSAPPRQNCRSDTARSLEARMERPRGQAARRDPPARGARDPIEGQDPRARSAVVPDEDEPAVDRQAGVQKLGRRGEDGVALAGGGSKRTSEVGLFMPSPATMA